MSIISDIAMSLMKIDNKYMIARLKIEKDRLETCLKVLLQLLNFAYKQLLNKPYENEVILTGQKPPLKFF